MNQRNQTKLIICVYSNYSVMAKQNIALIKNPCYSIPFWHLWVVLYKRYHKNLILLQPNSSYNDFKTFNSYVFEGIKEWKVNIEKDPLGNIFGMP